MDRKSIVLCLSILAVLVLGTGIAVAFLYSDVDSDRDRKTTGRVDPEKDRLFAAIPSDAVLVACFSEEGLLDSGMAVSLHYSGKLLPLYVYEAGAPSAEPSEDASRLMESLAAKGMTARYAVSEKALVVASPSEVLVQSSRYEGKSVVLDEAKMLCTPIVATAYPTVADQVADGQEGLVVSMSAEGIAEGVRRMLTDDALREGITAYLAAHEYGNQAEVKKYIKLLDV